jgi:3-isopropylmalate/(R)-2-methylmalate dehydratase small subunit
MNNRLLLVQLERDAVGALLRESSDEPASSILISLEAKTVTSATSGKVFNFALAATQRRNGRFNELA